MAGIPPLPPPQMPIPNPAVPGSFLPGLKVPVPQLPSSISGVTDFLSRLTEANTWIRAAEVILGLILVAVGVARITHAIPAATKIAGIAAKGAVIA